MTSPCEVQELPVEIPAWHVMELTPSGVEPLVLLRGKVCLYREKAPFVVSGYSTAGAMLMDPPSETVQCHECGGWFSSVLNHSAETHKLSGLDYRRRHQFALHSCLIGPTAHAERSQAAAARSHSHLLAKRWNGAQGKGLSSVHAGNTERRNVHGLCVAQATAAILRLRTQLGRTPTAAQLMAAGLYPKTLMKVFCLPTLGEVMRFVGLMPNPRGVSVPVVNTPEGLIERLRDFYVSRGRLPSEAEHISFLPSVSTYRRMFGSRAKAFQAAGLGLLAAKVANKSHA